MTSSMPRPTQDDAFDLLLWAFGATLLACAAAAGMLYMLLLAPGPGVLSAAGNAWAHLLVDHAWLYHAGMLLAVVGFHRLARRSRGKPKSAVAAMGLVGLLEIFSIAVTLGHTKDNETPFVPTLAKVEAATDLLGQAATLDPASYRTNPIERTRSLNDAARAAGNHTLDLAYEPLARTATGFTLSLAVPRPECLLRLAAASSPADRASYTLQRINGEPAQKGEALCFRRLRNDLVFAFAAP